MRHAVCIALAVLITSIPTLAQQQKRPITTPKVAPSAVLKFDSTPLSDVIETMHKMIGANIHVNWKALESENIHKDTPITLNVSGITVAKAFELILSEASPDDKLSLYVDHGVIEITTLELADKKLITRAYDVADLLVVFKPVNAPQVDLAQVTQNSGSSSSGGSGSSSGSSNSIFSNNSTNTNTANTDTTAQQKQKADDLVNLIKTTVRPEIWTDNGGPATIGYFGNHLIIRAPRSVHDAIAGRF